MLYVRWAYRWSLLVHFVQISGADQRSCANSSSETRPQDKRIVRSFKHLYDVPSPGHRDKRLRQNSLDGRKLNPVDVGRGKVEFTWDGFDSKRRPLVFAMCRHANMLDTWTICQHRQRRRSVPAGTNVNSSGFKILTENVETHFSKANGNVPSSLISLSWPILLPLFKFVLLYSFY